MNQKLFKIVLLLIAGMSIHSLANAASLKVVIEGIEQVKGTLSVTLFASEDQWLKEGIQVLKIPATEKEQTVIMETMDPGLYAVSVTHDVDDNGILNRGAFGKPEEPYGFSNNARAMFGPAKWKEAVFEVSEGENEIHLTIR